MFWICLTKTFCPFPKNSIKIYYSANWSKELSLQGHSEMVTEEMPRIAGANSIRQLMGSSSVSCRALQLSTFATLFIVRWPVNSNMPWSGALPPSTPRRELVSVTSWTMKMLFRLLRNKTHDSLARDIPLATPFNFVLSPCFKIMKIEKEYQEKIDFVLWVERKFLMLLRWVFSLILFWTTDGENEWGRTSWIIVQNFVVG